MSGTKHVPCERQPNRTRKVELVEVYAMPISVLALSIPEYTVSKLELAALVPYVSE